MIEACYFSQTEDVITRNYDVTYQMLCDDGIEVLLEITDETKQLVKEIHPLTCWHCSKIVLNFSIVETDNIRERQIDPS